MKLLRKKRRGIKIEHNKKLFWIIILLIILLALLIYAIAKNNKEKGISQTPNQECSKDEDCIINKCCHPDSCVPIEKAPSCKSIICSMVCSGPLDCSAGSCGCVKDKCAVVPNE